MHSVRIYRTSVIVRYLSGIFSVSTSFGTMVFRYNHNYDGFVVRIVERKMSDNRTKNFLEEF